MARRQCYFVEEGKVRDTEAKLWRKVMPDKKLKHIRIGIEPQVGMVVDNGKTGKLICLQGKGIGRVKRLLFAIMRE